MTFEKLLGSGEFILLDGALGTMLQQAGLRAGQRPEDFTLQSPERLEAIHRAYVQAGAQIICANTFGANAHKLAGSGITVKQAVEGAVRCARAAAGTKALVALDVGPMGELLAPAGSLTFEEAYAVFAELMRAGATAGADLVLIETIADLLEMKAAVLAAKENTTLPVLASMTFEADGRSFTGVQVEAFATAIGPLGPSTLGINCSLGPAQVMPVVARLCAATALPVFAKPNAGLPDPATGEYTLSADDFAEEMRPCLENGVAMVGGCCGTTPQSIERLAAFFAGKKPAHRAVEPNARLCGAGTVVAIDRPLAIGERINPTGKKALRQSLQNGELALAQALAKEQEAAGAAILDVNVGAAGVDEVALLPKAVQAVQAVSGLPLMLDSSNVEALAAALRVCIGKPVVNSTTGEDEKLAAVLPLCKKYGAAVLGLTLDEDGIPQTAQERLKIAKKILAAAQKAGLPEEDVWIDCLTMAVGAEPGAAGVTLGALRLVKERLAVKTVLGVSNVSFGLPARPLVNRSFLTMALAAGLDLPIINPADTEMMDALAAASLLTDAKDGGNAFVARFSGEGEPGTSSVKTRPAGTGAASEAMPLDVAIEQGLQAQAADAAGALITNDPGAAMTMMEQYLIPALDRVGKGFEDGTLFLPQLMASAAAAQAAFETVKKAVGGTGGQGPKVVVATVQGDIHDIGKNIAKVLLDNYGFSVTDLGRDVPPEAVVQAVQASGARLVGLSALMTTTLPSMEATIKALHTAGLDCRVFVGGAVLTEDYAGSIGADFYARDAMASADYARKLLM